jgi:uncharacterized membrane protein YagU involved in acid resistance
MEKPNLGKAILGGFIATLVMTMMMYAAPMVGMPKMDTAAMLGSMMSQRMPAPMSGPWLAGMVMHFLNGAIIFPLIYALLLTRILPGAQWLKGLIWGLILFLLAQMMVMPMMGMGIFSANAPKAMMSVMGSLMGHVIYGVILGGIAGGMAGSIAQQKRA